MAYAAYDDAACAFGFFGLFDLITVGGQRCWQADWATWTGYLAGTDGVMSCHAGGPNPFWVSVDGGAFTNPTKAGDDTIVLFSGLADAPHLVRIYSDGSYTTTNARTDLAGDVLRVTGQAPAIGYGPDLGPAYQWFDPRFPGTANFFAAPSTNIVGGGNANITPAFVANRAHGACGSALFRARCSTILLYTGDPQARFGVDGGPLTTVTLDDPSSPRRRWRFVATGLDDAEFHDYFVTSGLDYNAAVGAVAMGVMIGGPGAAFRSRKFPKLVQLGDSITEGVAAANQSDVDVYGYSNALGHVGINIGTAGLTSANLVPLMADRLGNLGLVGPPEVAVMAMGRNDSGSGSLAADYATNVNALLANGSKQVLCRFPGLGSSGDVDATLAAAVAALANPNVVAIPTADWSGVATSDGTHPTTAGYATMAGHAAGDFAPYLKAAEAEGGGTVVVTGKNLSVSTSRGR